MGESLIDFVPLNAADQREIVPVGEGKPGDRGEVLQKGAEITDLRIHSGGSILNAEFS
jgi:hypothetical protein